MRVNGVEGSRLVLEAFLRLHKSGFNLGVDEYLAGLALVPDDALSLPFARDLDGLKQSLKLLWCTSQSEQRQFDPVWDKALAAAESASPIIIEKDNSPLPPPPPPIEPPLPFQPGPEVSLSESVTEKETAPNLEAAAQPVRAPCYPRRN
jgi:hypothetical protein